MDAPMYHVFIRLHSNLRVFECFLALFSQISKEYPGRGEEKAFFRENPGDLGTKLPQTVIRFQVLENR